MHCQGEIERCCTGDPTEFVCFSVQQSESACKRSKLIPGKIKMSEDFQELLMKGLILFMRV